MSRFAIIALAAFTSACASVVDAPPLGPRGAETIDPRLPVAASEDLAPPSELAARALAIADRIDTTEKFAFQRLEDDVWRAVRAAGAKESESWVYAQIMVSRLEETRRPVTTGLADIGEVASEAIAADASLTLADRRAIERAADIVSLIDSMQRGVIRAMRQQLAN